MKRYQQIARLLATIQYCRETGNEEWERRHGERLEAILALAPSGSGFDYGTQLDRLASDGTFRLSFVTAFHHMTEHGDYDVWTEHRVVARASLQDGFTLRVTGVNRNEIKDYIEEVFAGWLSEENDPEDYQETAARKVQTHA